VRGLLHGGRETAVLPAEDRIGHGANSVIALAEEPPRIKLDPPSQKHHITLPSPLASMAEQRRIENGAVLEQKAPAN
jgi:hypothetical protein